MAVSQTTGSTDEEFVRFERETSGYASDITAEPEIIPPNEDETEGGEPDFPLELFITEEVVATILAIPGTMMARKTGREWWRLDEDELNLLGKAGAPIARYYAQKWLSGAGPAAGIGLALGIVYGPRMYQEMQERKEEKEVARKRRQASPPVSASSSEGGAAESQQSSSDYKSPFVA